jgi:hypothetical protein
MAMLTRILLAAAMLAVPLCGASAAQRAPARAPAPPPSVAQFDGNWSVSIITDSGTCDRGYRYAVRILNGQIYYNNPNINLSGQVNARGYVSVQVGAGSQQAVGTGRLSRDYGDGTWSGRSATDQCSGRWEAERRDQTSGN